MTLPCPCQAATSTTMGPSAAQAATAPDAVMVAGTRAAGRTVLESTSPVDVLSAEDIRKAGVVNGELGSALQAFAGPLLANPATVGP